jgi:hypothetical protein
MQDDGCRLECIQAAAVFAIGHLIALSELREVAAIGEGLPG